MLSALLRAFKGSSSQVEEHADLEQDIQFRPSVAEYRRHLHATADFTEADDDDDDDEESNDGGRNRYPPGSRPEDEDGLPRSGSLLPLFSADHLGWCLFFSLFSIVPASPGREAPIVASNSQ
jgi:hypothetical protein